MAITDPSERKILASGLLALGCSSGALAAALGVTAFGHMAGAASICGLAAEHCSACYGAMATLSVTLITGWSGLSLLRPSGPRLIESRARS